MKIQYGFKTDIDFGLLQGEYKKGELDVSRGFWAEYLDKRFSFELMHDKLLRKIKHNKDVTKWLKPEEMGGK